MKPLNSASFGAMGSLLKKLHEQMHTEDEAQQLRSDLGTISTKMEKLAEVHEPILTVKYWMSDARKLSYDLEVWVDQFVNASNPDAKKAFLAKIIGFEKHVKELNERCDGYNLVSKYVPSSPTNNILVSHDLSTLHAEPEIAISVSIQGIEDPTNKLLEWVKPKEQGEDNPQLMVIPILGSDGVGKTTLAKQLWRESLEGKFECRAFVRTAKKSDTRMILRSILSQVRAKQPSAASKVPNLIHDLREHLQGKRYIIVIDELWAVSVWDIVRRALPDGNHCSRIITTAAVENVALACCNYDRNNIVNIKLLSDAQSEKLFVNTVFGSGKECPQHLYNDSCEIWRKCGGLPLAIICVATLLARQLETKQQWEYVKNFLRDNLRNNSTSVEILDQVLKLCYNSLPHCLKTCLLYLSVYPENYPIPKEDLVRQWIAEDFICTTEGKDIGEVASNYFDDLVSLGLIQRMDIKKDVFYAVHPMVFDFTTRKSMEENFVMTIDYSQSTVVLTEKIRRLALHFGSATYANTPESIGLCQVRSLSFVGLMSCMPSLAEFKLVRVVILHFWADDEGTSFPLSKICELLLLRYLQVRCNVTVELPDQMQCLKHLETLEINAVVAAVPLDILSLPGLLHVRLGRKAKPTHLTLGPVTSGEVIFLNVSSSTSSHPIQVFELLPPICIFSKLPWWFKRLHGLCTMEVVVRELGTYDMEFLAGLQALTDLSLYVRKPTVGRVIRIRRGACSALKYFKLVSGRLLLSFGEGAMPNLQMLEIAFNAHKHQRYGDLLQLGGIEHLSNLQEVAAGIGAATGAEETDRIAAESAFRDSIGRHPCLSNCKVKRVDPIDEECDHSGIEDWSPEAEFSNVQDKVTQPPPEAAAAIAGHKERGQLEIQDWNPGLEKLLLLRYLSLRGTDVSALPETIGELKYLQTLDVRSTKVRELPNSVIKLEKLMHLLAGNAKLPCGVAKMKALQTVSCAIVTDTSTSIIQELIELAGLKELELYCDFTEMPGCEKQVTFPGGGFWGLQKLCIRCNSASVTFQPDVLPMVEVLELSFDGLLDDESSSASGIEHLLSLKHVLLEFTKQGAGAMATEEAVRKAASTRYPHDPTVTVKLEEDKVTQLPPEAAAIAGHKERGQLEHPRDPIPGPPSCHALRLHRYAHRPRRARGGGGQDGYGG